jgi:hypothetical protein
MTHDDIKTANAASIATPQDGAAPDIVDPDLAAANKSLDEDSALAWLQRADLSPELIEKIKGSVASKSRKVKLAMIGHANTPRHISLSLLRKLFTFDLMRVALTPAVVGDIKMAAEEVLINRLETISAGEKLSLARRASGRVAGALLLSAEPRIIAAGLENPRLTEGLVTKAVLSDEASPVLVQAVCTHSKWSLRREVRIALLRNQHTPLLHAIEFANSLPDGVVNEVLQNSKLPGSVRVQLAQNTLGS